MSRSFAYWRDFLGWMRGGLPYITRLSKDGGETCPFAGGTAYLSHELVVERLRGLARGEAQGCRKEFNELGLAELRGTMFPEYGKIALAYPEHDRLRPWLEAILDGRWNQWTPESLRADAAAFLAQRPRLRLPEDALEWTPGVLLRIVGGVELTAAECREFVEYQKVCMKVGLLPAALGWLTRGKIKRALAVRAKLIGRLTASVPGFFASQGESRPSDDDVALLASALLDACTYAGGISVPTVIRSGAAVRFQAERYGLTDADLGPENIDRFVLETCRLFGPVSGVPFQQDNERSYAVLWSAQVDKAAWGSDADRFRIRDAAAYADKFIGFAEPAGGAGAASRDCPGKALGLAMIKAFLLELDLRTWRGPPSIAELPGPRFFEPFELERSTDP